MARKPQPPVQPERPAARLGVATRNVGNDGRLARGEPVAAHRRTHDGQRSLRDRNRKGRSAHSRGARAATPQAPRPSRRPIIRRRPPPRRFRRQPRNQRRSSRRPPPRPTTLTRSNRRWWAPPICGPIRRPRPSSKSARAFGRRQAAADRGDEDLQRHRGAEGRRRDRILVEDGQPVEYGEPLLVIE